MSPTSFIRCLAILALLHQQGACACGCPEHNGWLISARSLMAVAETVAGHEHCHHSGDSQQVDAAHCDGGAKAVYLVRVSPQVIDLPAMPLGTRDTLAIGSSAMCLKAAFSSVDQPCLPGSAPSVRAELGVFLL